MPSNAASTSNLRNQTLVENVEKERKIIEANNTYKTLVRKMGYGVDAYFSFQC